MTKLALKHKTAFESGRLNTPLSLSCRYLDAYLENLGRSPALREAYAIAALWDGADVSVDRDELIIGRLRYCEPVFFHIGGGTVVNNGTAAQYCIQQGFTEHQTAAFMSKLETVYSSKYLCYFDEAFSRYHDKLYSDEQIAAMCSSAAGTTAFGGHMVIDYDGILSNGLDFYFGKLAEYDNGSEYYLALKTILLALIGVIERTADECGKQNIAAQSDLQHIAHRKPVSFFQGLELVLFAHICSGSDSLGRFDQYLYPLYKNDIENAVIDDEYALSMLESFMIKIEEQNEIQNMTIGGASSYSELTKLILKAVRNVGYKGPNLCIRVCESMDPAYWDEIALSFGSGQGLPALYNDDVITGFLIKDGFSIEDAENYCLAGCSQVMIGGSSQFVNDIGSMNACKILEITYFGNDEFNAIETGLPFENDIFDSFESFLDAYKRNLSHYASLMAAINNTDIALRAKTEGYIFRSLFTENCIESGKGVFEGGARLNRVEMEIMGLTNAADSLYCIKKTVFEDKTVSFDELLQALRANFDGYDNLRKHLKYNIAKFGNGNDALDSIRREITECVYDAVREQAGVLGGQNNHYIPGEVIFVAHESHGYVTGATPDGRYAREVLADSAGAAQGCNVSGLAPLMRSVLLIPADKIVTSIVFNVKFIKSSWDNDKKGVMEHIKTFFKQGGQQIQVNVCDNKELQSAYENPEKHRSLIIRVGGYSAYFVTLSKALQREIISRK